MNKEEVHLWFWQSTNAEMHSVAVRAAAFLDAAERARAMRFARPRDSWRFQASRVFLRSILARYTKTCPSQLPLQIGDAGKPFICPSAGNDLSFSLSHCGSSVALAVGRGVMLGVDIEGPPSTSLLEALARRYFAPREFDEIVHLQGEDRTKRFQAYWTLKEAYGKAVGTGLADGLRAQFAICDPEGRIYKYDSDDEPDPAWSFAQFGVGKHLCMSAAWNGGVSRANVRLFQVTGDIQEQGFGSVSARDVTFTSSPRCMAPY